MRKIIKILKKNISITVFENHRKSLIQQERSELRSHFEWTKVNSKYQKLRFRTVKQRYQIGHF